MDTQDALGTIAGLSGVVLFAWAIADAMASPRDPTRSTSERLAWVLIILVGNLVGVFLYLARGRRSGNRLTNEVHRSTN